MKFEKVKITVLGAAIASVLVAGVPSASGQGVSIGTAAGQATGLVSSVPITNTATILSPVGSPAADGGVRAGQVQTVQQLYSMNKYLQDGMGTGNGLLPLLSTISSGIEKLNASQGQSLVNSDAASRGQIADQAMMNQMMGAIPTKTRLLLACARVSKRIIGTDGTLAAGGSSSRVLSSASDSVDMVEEYSSSGTEIEKAGARSTSHVDGGFCTQENVDTGFPGCKSVGRLAGNNMLMNSLFYGHPGSNSGSLDADGVSAANSYVYTSSPQAPAIPAGMGGSSAFLKVQPSLLNAIAIQSSASSVLKDIRRSNTQMSSAQADAKSANTTSFQKSGTSSSWAGQQQNWESTFGSGWAFPATPSEMDMLRFEAYFNKYSPKAALKSASFSESDVALLDGVSSTNLLLFRMLETQQRTNVLLSQILNLDVGRRFQELEKQMGGAAQAAPSRSIPKPAPPAQPVVPPAR